MHTNHISQLGTSNLSNYFYGHVDHDLGSRWESWYKMNFAALIEYFDQPAVFKRAHMAKALLSTFIHYLGWNRRILSEMLSCILNL